MNALGRIGRGNYCVIEPYWSGLFRFASDEEAKVRLSFIWASENIATNTPDIYEDYMPIFAGLLYDADEKVRMEAPEINRHGDFDPPELRRLLKPGGLFITQQVGSDNDRELVELVLPGAEKPFPHENLREQRSGFAEAGFELLRAEEAFGPISFFDVGAFVWFARIIEWEFPGFSVDRCFDRLLRLQETVEREGKITGTTHRYLIAAKKS